MSGRILVVEDNEANAELLCDWLELNDYNAVAVADLANAYSALQNSPFDSVLLDIQLGNEDGAELATWIRQQPATRNMPVIAVTAHALPAEQRRVVHAGCSTCVSKPIDFVNLAKLLGQWLANYASLRSLGSNPATRT
jgi:two-component system cell cycle response regulator DivK